MFVLLVDGWVEFVTQADRLILDTKTANNIKKALSAVFPAAAGKLRQIPNQP